VIWIATANDERAIPEPLLNRVNVYAVHAPDREQARAIALRLYAQLRRDHHWGERFADTPSDEVQERMSELAPREMRRAWTTAFGNARLAGRGAVEPCDLPQAGAKRGPIGFMQ
jgi:ATP-dependent Lon protease